MNFKHIMIVFKKEMKDAFRDRKSVLTNIFLPLILIPLIYYFMNMAMSGATKDVEENMKIAILTNEDRTQVETFTKQNIIGEDKIEIVNVANEEEAKKALEEGNINCILRYSDGFLQEIENGKMAGIKIEYNALKSSSSIGMQMLQNKVMALNQVMATQKLAEINVSPEILNLVNIETTDVSVQNNNGKKSNDMIAMIVPMYLVIIIVTAGVPLAVDVIAGERERNTFEALLSTKANRLSILIGKYLAILVFSLIAIIMSFIGLIIGMVMNPELFASGDQEMTLAAILQSMNMPVGAMLLSLLSAITLTIAFAGIQMAISTVSKSVKEAQTYLSYMSMPAMILGFATLFMGAGDMQNYMAYIPIFNTIASLKMVLSGVINYSFLTIGVIINIIFVVIVSIYITKLFNNEKVIIK